MDKIELYEETYNADKHFSFGENWKRYISTLDEEKIAEAEKSLVVFLGGSNKLKNKSFIDIGCGSGLFSLAANRAKAKIVISVDVDSSSIYCAKELRKRWSKNPKTWSIKEDSILNKKFVKSLGKYDIIYSWGVLHHTGNMYEAFSNLDILTKKNSLVYLAIYNDNKRTVEGTSKHWLKIKRKYNNSNKFVKKTMYHAYKSYLIAGITASGKNPCKYIKNYKTLRGMDFYIDIKDWLGGYPYEYMSMNALIKYFKKSGYKILKTKKARSIGCNEILLEKI